MKKSAVAAWVAFALAGLMGMVVSAAQASSKPAAPDKSGPPQAEQKTVQKTAQATAAAAVAGPRISLPPVDSPFEESLLAQHLPSPADRASLEQAVELSKGCPMLQGEGSVEVRPVMAASF